MQLKEVTTRKLYMNAMKVVSPVSLFSFSVIKCLLGKSCRFLVPDKDGNTALHLACQNGHYEATELLLQSQIGLNQR